MKLNQPFCEHRQALKITVGEAVNNVEAVPLDIRAPRKIAASPELCESDA